MTKTRYQYNKEWRKRYPRIWQATKKRYYQKTQGGDNEKARYIMMDEIDILSHRIPDSWLSSWIGRSVEAIQVKRCKLKKIL